MTLLLLVSHTATITGIPNAAGAKSTVHFSMDILELMSTVQLMCLPQPAFSQVRTP